MYYNNNIKIQLTSMKTLIFPKIKVTSIAILLFLSECQLSFCQTITTSFAQKIAQYDELGDFSCGLAKVRKGGKYGFIDKSGNEIVECSYDEVGDFHDFMAYVQTHDRKYGYIDNMGDLVIPCKYKRAQDFSEGLSWVNDDGPWCCIDKNGKVVFTLGIMSEARTDYKDGLSVITPPDGESSIVDANGKVINLSGHSWLGNGVSDGMILCEVPSGEDGNMKNVYIDTKGKVVIECNPHYSYHPFHNGLAAVMCYQSEAEEGYKVGYIDKTGEFVIPLTLPCTGFDDMDDFPDPIACCEGMIRSIKTIGNDENGDFSFLYGFVDDKGNLVVPYKYTDAHDFSGGLAAVCDDEGKWGFIDKGGNIIIPFKYDGVSWNSFQDGFALVQIGDKYGYVDKQGNDTYSLK